MIGPLTVQIWDLWKMLNLFFKYYFVNSTVDKSIWMIMYMILSVLVKHINLSLIMLEKCCEVILDHILKPKAVPMWDWVG